MAETEVESILREIREQVLAQQRSAQASTSAVANLGNGDGESGAVNNTLIEDKLALYNSYLTTTSRTWDRLPPLVSNRTGATARLELWVKRLLKRATRWFTWEQVNFNASTHHALGELSALLAALEREMASLREQLKSMQDSQFVTTEQVQADLRTQREELEMQRRTMAALVSEFRERVMHVQEEHRVGFKQLALESSEAATLEDRRRRQTEALLEELHRRLDQLEQPKQ